VGRVEVDRNYFSSNFEYDQSLESSLTLDYAATIAQLESDAKERLNTTAQSRINAEVARVIGVKAAPITGTALSVNGPSDVYVHGNEFDRLENIAAIKRFGSVTTALMGFFPRPSPLMNNYQSNSGKGVDLDSTARFRVQVGLPGYDVDTEYCPIFNSPGPRDSTRFWCVDDTDGVLVEGGDCSC
jgi:hypothetical protein